ncbi:uncharacterized protein LOC115222616 [Argonauta hians]
MESPVENSESPFITLDDLILSQTHNPSSDVGWQVVSPDALHKIHKAILQSHKLRKKKANLVKHENSSTKDSEETTMATNRANVSGIIRRKKRVRMRKKINPEIDNAIKQIEMKLQSRVVDASDRSSTQSTAENNHTPNFKLNQTPEKVADVRPCTTESPPATYIMVVSNTNNVTCSEDELLNETLMEDTPLSDSCLNNKQKDNISASSVQKHWTSVESSAGKKLLMKKRQQFQIKKDDDDSTEKSVRENTSTQRIANTCKISELTSLENLSDSDIDDIISQVPEENFVEAETCRISVSPECSSHDYLSTPVRVTRQIAKTAAAGSKDLKKSCQVSPKPSMSKCEDKKGKETAKTKEYYLRNSSAKSKLSRSSPKSSVRSNRYCFQLAPQRTEEEFDDSGLNDSDIDDIISQVPEENFVEAETCRISVSPECSSRDYLSTPVRVTRQIAKTAAVGSKDLKKSCQVSPKPSMSKCEDKKGKETAKTKEYYLRNSSAKSKLSRSSPKSSVRSNRYCFQLAPQRPVEIQKDAGPTDDDDDDDLFEDSELTDELLASVYEDIFKDDMEPDDGVTI